MQPSSVKDGLGVIEEGYGVVRGKWLCSTKELFDQHGIKVCYENLGWYQPGIVATTPPPRFLEKLGKKSQLAARVDRFIQKRKRKMAQRKKKHFLKKSTQ
jgi:hypothetical protein